MENHRRSKSMEPITAIRMKLGFVNPAIAPTSVLVSTADRHVRDNSEEAIMAAVIRNAIESGVTVAPRLNESPVAAAARITPPAAIEENAIRCATSSKQAAPSAYRSEDMRRAPVKSLMPELVKMADPTAARE
jgi:hypothetical protein